MLTDEQTKLARDLLDARPPVFPGTRAILNETQKKAWYDMVCAAMTATSITGDADVATFCDVAGVAD